MQRHHQEPGGYREGDKVRIRAGVFAGRRGLVEDQEDHLIAVRLDTGERVVVPAGDLTNFSLAARRAWAVMPKRAGRPPSTGQTKRMVSIRIDADIWEGLAVAVKAGLIPSREQAVNEWLRKHLAQLTSEATEDEA